MKVPQNSKWIPRKWLWVSLIKFCRALGTPSYHTTNEPLFSMIKGTYAKSNVSPYSGTITVGFSPSP